MRPTLLDPSFNPPAARACASASGAMSASTSRKSFDTRRFARSRNKRNRTRRLVAPEEVGHRVQRADGILPRLDRAAALKQTAPSAAARRRCPSAPAGSLLASCSRKRGSSLRAASTSGSKSGALPVPLRCASSRRCCSAPRIAAGDAGIERRSAPRAASRRTPGGSPLRPAWPPWPRAWPVRAQCRCRAG